MIWQAILLVEPAGKGRPRFGGGRTFTPPKTRFKEEEIRYWLAKEEAPKFEGPVSLDLRAVFKKPKSAPKKRIHHTVKPDGSNILKLVEDAANGILWDDDSQIVEATVRKEYGDPARIEIRVEAV